MRGASSMGLVLLAGACGGQISGETAAGGGESAGGTRVGVESGGTGGGVESGGTGGATGGIPSVGGTPAAGTGGWGLTPEPFGGGTGGTPPGLLLDACLLHACEPAAASPDVFLIDPIESEPADPDGNLLPERDQRRGSWYVYADASAAGQWTSGTEGGKPVAQSLDAFNGEAFVISGQHFGDWGAGIGVQLNAPNGAACPYDLTETVGLRFWYRSSMQVRLQVLTEATTPCNDSNAGLCPSNCYDHFSVTFPATAEWTEANVFWTELTVAGWGTPPQVEFDRGAVLGFEWQVGPVAADGFELGIDELEFNPWDY